MSSPQQACTVVGRGAIGLLAACRLQRAGWLVTLHLKQPTAVRVDFFDQAGVFKASFAPAEAPLHKVLLPVKAYDTLSCLRQLSVQLAVDAQVVISHNGMPDLPALQACMQAGQGLWFLSTSHAALRLADQVQHTGIGQSILAPLNTEARMREHDILPWLELALGPVKVVKDILPPLWQKLAANAVINPLTVLHNCRNGSLAQLRFRKHIKQLVKEVSLVAAAEGIDFNEEATQQWILTVISRTADNYSSMHQDVSYGRTTELAAITGFLLNKAAQHQLVLPAHQQLYQALQAKQVKA